MTRVIEFTEYVERTSLPAIITHSIDSQLNDFLRHNDVTVVDIKYQVISNEYSEPRSRALLIYREE